MRQSINKILSLTFCAIWLLIIAQITFAQTTGFTYQGKLSDSSGPANGNFDLQFKLFDTATVGTGTQQGTTVTLSNVTVTGGIFTGSLDFGACASCFNGAPRFLEIAVKAVAAGSFTTLAPRQQVSSNPYAIRSSTAAAADTATNTTQLGGLPASGFIQNTTSSQAGTNFNIGGDGAANTFTAGTQYNVGLNRVLTVNGMNFTNTFVGVEAGKQDPSGNFNSFFGNGSGKLTTTGGNNSFYGSGSGNANQSGSDNAFFGRNAGFASTGSQNSFFGSFAGAASSNTADGNSFFGYQSGRVNTFGTQNSFFGFNSGTANTTGGRNTFLGYESGLSNTTGLHNSFFGYQSGALNTRGFQNLFLGVFSGLSNTVENNNTFIGSYANGTPGISNATAIGAFATVTQSNSLVLGSIVGVNFADADTNVGIGTTAPLSILHLNGQTGNFAVTLTNIANTLGRRGYRLAFDSDRFSFQRADDAGNFAANQVAIDQATGNVGIGTVSPDRTLTVNGAADKPGGGSWEIFSDERLKTIKGRFLPGLKAVMQLQPIRYEYKPDNALGLRSSGEHIGFGAQAVQKIIPEAVTQNDKGYLLVNNDPILWTMLNAIKEQQQTIEKLQQENSKLKTHNAETETRLTAVETSVKRMAQQDRRHRRLR